MKTRLDLILSFLLLLAFNSFGQVVIRQIQPSTTDPLISTFDNASYVYLNESVTAKNILVVHLPGSYGNPNKAQLFGTLAADLGFHSIGLSYPNIPTVSSICTNSSDPSCYENVRREVITGVDLSTGVSVDTTECIFNRVEKLLIYLEANYPSENWGQFLDTNNGLIYSKIIFSGHSQGGGYSALIAKDYAIKRAICFSAPKDYSSYFNAPASWVYSTNWQTPKSEIYTFVHTLDNYNEQLEILDSLGLGAYGPPVDIDNNSSPYNNTLQLITSYAVSSGDEHGSTVVDNKTPLNSGIPVFLPVWTYMLTNNISTSLTPAHEYDNYNIKVYPNPTTGLLQFQFDKIPKELEISVYSVLGEKILTFKNQTKINISHFTNGIYYIKIKVAKKIKMQKILKTK